MLPTVRPAVVTLLALLACAQALIAQERPEQQQQQQQQQQRPARPASEGGVLRLLPADAVSEKQITAAGRSIRYTAAAGTFSLYDQNGERSAAVFYTAYVENNANAARRPVTFVF